MAGSTFDNEETFQISYHHLVWAMSLRESMIIKKYIYIYIIERERERERFYFLFLNIILKEFLKFWRLVGSCNPSLYGPPGAKAEPGRLRVFH